MKVNTAIKQINEDQDFKPYKEVKELEEKRKE